MAQTQILVMTVHNDLDLGDRTLVQGHDTKRSGEIWSRGEICFFTLVPGA